MITTGITHAFGLDHHKRDDLTGTRTMARGWAYTKKDWFVLSIGSKEEVQITWSEWNEIVASVEELRKISTLEFRPVQPWPSPAHTADSL